MSLFEVKFTKDCLDVCVCVVFLDICLCSVRSEEHVQMLRQEFPSDRLFPLIIDVTIPETIKTAKLFIKQTVGESGLVALINNAGIAIPGPLEVISDELIKQQFDVNVFGVIRGRYHSSLCDHFHRSDSLSLCVCVCMLFCL
jgi:NADP-dependent 3-hydroxy acid dehydrogenase YdfG